MLIFTIESIMQSVVMPNVVMPSVVAPISHSLSVLLLDVSLYCVLYVRPITSTLFTVCHSKLNERGGEHSGHKNGLEVKHFNFLVFTF